MPPPLPPILLILTHFLQATNKMHFRPCYSAFNLFFASLWQMTHLLVFHDSEGFLRLHRLLQIGGNRIWKKNATSFKWSLGGLYGYPLFGLLINTVKM